MTPHAAPYLLQAAHQVDAHFLVNDATWRYDLGQILS